MFTSIQLSSTIEHCRISPPKIHGKKCNSGNSNHVSDNTSRKMPIQRGPPPPANDHAPPTTSHSNRKCECFRGLKDKIKANSGKKNWTILLYLNADCHGVAGYQEAKFLEEFVDAAKVGSTENISIVCQLDRYTGEYYDNASYGNWTGTKRFYITENMEPTPQNAVQNLSEKNMGSPAVFKNFLMWAIEQYPAEHYLLGTIVRDYYKVADNNAVYENQDPLEPSEFTNVLRDVKRKTGESIDVILPYEAGFDGYHSNLYATATLYGLANVVKGIVFMDYYAYEEDTYNMDKILENITQDPTCSPLETAEIIADIHFDTGGYAGRWTSAINITAFNKKVRSPLNKLAKILLRREYYPNASDLQDALAGGWAQGANSAYDLLNLTLEILDHTDPAATIHAVATDLKNALEDSILYCKKYNAPDYHGIMIQLNDDSEWYSDDWENVHGMEFGKETFWDEFWRVKSDHEYDDHVDNVTYVYNTTLSQPNDNSYVNASFNFDSKEDLNLTLNLYGISESKGGELLLDQKNVSIQGNDHANGTRGWVDFHYLRFPYTGDWSLRLETFRKEDQKELNIMYPGVMNQSEGLENIHYESGGYPEIEVTAPQSYELTREDSLTVEFQVDYANEFVIYSRVDWGEWDPHGPDVSTSIEVDISRLWDWNQYNTTIHRVQLMVDDYFGGKPIKSLEIPIRVDNTENNILVIANRERGGGEYLPEGLRKIGYGENYNWTYPYNGTHYGVPCLSPSSETMSEYDLVYWLAGTGRTLKLEAYKRNQIASYLDEYNGKLALSGDNLAKNLHTSDADFLHDYLKANYVQDATTNDTGTRDWTVFHGLEPNGGWEDLVSPLSNARKIISVNNSDLCGGVQYANEYKLVFTTRKADATGFMDKAYVNRTIRFLNTSKPDFSIAHPRHENYYNDTEVAFEGTVTDPDGDYQSTRLDIEDGTTLSLNRPWDLNHTFAGEGTFKAQYEAWDWIGHHSVYKMNITIDLTNPTLSITYPVNGTDIASKSINLTWESMDKHFDTFSYRKTSSWVNTTRVWQPFYSLSEGYHTFSVRSYDKAGNTNTSTITVFVDGTAPQVDFLTKNQSFYNESNVTIEWTASDDGSSINISRICIDQGDWLSVPASGNHTFDLMEGSHLFYLLVEDDLGNNNTTSLRVNIDLTTPSLTITHPEIEETPYWSRENINITYDTGDTHYNCSRLYINRSLYETYSSEGLITISLTLNEGCYEIYLTSIDRVGNTNKSRNFFVKVDNTPPRINFTYPNYAKSKNVHITWNSTDNFFVNTCQMKVNTGDWLNVSSSGNYTLDLSVGDHTVHFTVTDMVDNEISTKLEIIVDTSLPSLTVTEPVYGTWIDSSSVKIEWNGSDEHFSQYEIRINDGIWTEIGNREEKTITGLSQGAQTVDVKAVDKAGNSRKDSILFYVDKESPIVDIIEPMRPVVLRKFNLTWDTTDNMGIEKIKVGLNTSLTRTYYNSSISRHQFEEVPLGYWRINVRIYDHVNNTALATKLVEVRRMSITVENIPEHAYTRKEPMEIEWSVEGKGLDRIEVYLEGEQVKVLSWKNLSYTLQLEKNTTTKDFHVKVKLFDRYGNQKIDKILITFDTKKPSIGAILPKNHTYTNKNLNITWNGSDIHITKLYHNNSLVTTIQETNYHVNLSQGANRIKLIILDKAGNQAEYYLLLYLDTQCPNIITTNPSNNTEIKKSENIKVKWQVTENQILENVSVFLDGTLSGSYNKSTGTHDITASIKAGNHTVKIIAFDKAGNLHSVLIYVLILKEQNLYTSEALIVLLFLALGVIFATKGGKKLLKRH